MAQALQLLVPFPKYQLQPMRLLHTKTLKLEEFYTDIPPYAILSHTWEKEEITFQDIQNLEVAKGKAGYAKVENACKRARQYNFDWIWIDSCCINKESSAELSEALNSMYQYYEDAEVCYAYLSDVSGKIHPRDAGSTFRSSRWFKRGWTLQELLAPSYVVFLDQEWVKLGTRWNLRDVVSAITSIPTRVFENGDIDGFSIAQRMSWAAYRETTRAEDQAYCLLGIFGVNIPPIYGEGAAKAFMRLQQEIIKISDDRSIFAWVASTNTPRGLLARSPYEFRLAGDILASDAHAIRGKSSFSFGNNGVHISLGMRPLDQKRLDGVFYASLDCKSAKDPKGRYFTVFLLPMKSPQEEWRRVCADESFLANRPPPHTLFDITVKEPSVLRRKNWKPVRGQHVRVHTKLLLSAEDHFSYTQWVESSPSLAVDFLDDSTFRVALQHENRKSVWELIATNYQSLSREDSFSISFNPAHVPGYKLVTDIAPAGAPEKQTFGFDPYVDSVTKSFKNGGVVSVDWEMTGDRSERLLEVGYVSKNDPNTPFFLQTPTRSPGIGFTVPTKVSHPFCELTLQEVYPRSRCITESDSEDWNHFIILDPPSFALSQSCHVLTYKVDLPKQGHVTSSQPPRYIQVAVGFHSATAWVGVTSGKENAARVWERYPLAEHHPPSAKLKLEAETHELDFVFSVHGFKNKQQGPHILDCTVSRPGELAPGPIGRILGRHFRRRSGITTAEKALQSP
ncbi:hypothetical protein D9758_013177 [Tetrapyrgos nigripes]|uniref:Heterokaryon incompatibility domain-containing protein n=1 Tax=Tetrapyrgos nigripes TaxID=182062 RepID=A0A8H5FKG0_9AGAR|nr:hypothetical protein D9758_013177 [Tetrapyrgos nigripes]